MNRYKVTIQASKAGSIGTKYCETRFYTLWAIDHEAVLRGAIETAHNDGLEHVLVTRVVEDRHDG